MEQKDFLELASAWYNVDLWWVAWCVDSDTEFLTPTWWKKISEYKDWDIIWEYNLNTWYCEFKKPLKYIKESTDEDAFIIKWKRINMFLTWEHTVLYKDSRYKNFHTNSMKNIFDDLNKIKETKTSKYNIVSNFKPDISIKWIDLTDNELKLMIAVIADWHFHNHINRCRINIKKKRKQDRLRLLLNNCWIKYEEHSRNNVDKEYINFIFIAPRHDKIFNEYYWWCNTEQLKIIYDEFVYWDWYIDKRNWNKIFTTTIKESYDFIQYVINTCSDYISSWTYTSRVWQERTYWNWKNYTRKSIDYSVRETSIKSWSWLQKKHISLWKLIDWYKYCFTTSNWYWIARKWNFIFITWNSWKTTVLKQFITEQEKLWKNIIIVAPTWIAAINVWWATIHSTFKIFWNEYSRTNKQKVNWRWVDIIIIDEKSMIWPDLFDHMNDIICKYRKEKDKAFWWIQIILCGDMAQLPPIYSLKTKEDIEHNQQIKSKYWKLIYSSANTYKNWNFKEVFLTKIFRQSDNRLIDILNDLREWDLVALNKLQKWWYNEKQEKESVHIMPRNDMVDKYNQKQFDLITNETTKYFKWDVMWKFNTDTVLTPVDLYLKRRCRVMLTRNIFEEWLYNWDIWIVDKIREDHVVVDFDRVGKKMIPYMTWENIEYDWDERNVIWEFTQIPLKLSYAITCHKAQWLSLSHVIVHYIHWMSNAALYVAVSRAETYENLFLAN